MPAIPGFTHWYNTGPLLAPVVFKEPCQELDEVMTVFDDEDMEYITLLYPCPTVRLVPTNAIAKSFFSSLPNDIFFHTERHNLICFDSGFAGCGR